MGNIFLTSFLTFAICVSFSFAQAQFESDTLKTSSGNLEITFVAHGTLYFTYNGLVIHIDPVGMYADYSKMPKADIILITHHHGDHLDSKSVELIRKENTDLICTEACFEVLKNGTVMKNGDVKFIKGIKVESVPAYNIAHKRDNGEPSHPMGAGNGYVITFGEKKVYIAGDTENIPEMKKLKGIDIAFLPMNLPYTMTPEMVVSAVNMINPKILYPYHFGKTNLDELKTLMANNKKCEVRIRKMQ